MVEEPSHIKQLSLNHVCKIGLKVNSNEKKRWVGKEIIIEHQSGAVAIEG
jgi:hypothetical protein